MVVMVSDSAGNGSDDDSDDNDNVNNGEMSVWLWVSTCGSQRTILWRQISLLTIR